TGRHPKCADCMVHCGYEPTAINDTFAHPIKALKVALLGPRVDGPLAPELPITYADPSPSGRKISFVATRKAELAAEERVP
ncbi:MAG TPA: DUF3463 domain-containing protein, partial [Burkholderiales bacterium]|nr:DUF3463 domain-containing protein [Burkholderiales bacterium]